MTVSNVVRRLGTAASVCALAVAGCAGGGGGLTPAPIGTQTAQATASRSSVVISITFPAQTTSSMSRRPAYISPSIASLTVSIDAATPIAINAPTQASSPQTITRSIAVAPGMHAFELAEYDAANGVGNLLGRVDQNANVVIDTANVLPFTLDGQLASIVIQPPMSAFVEGSLAAGFTLVGCQPQTFNAVPKDADGNTIVMPGLVPQVTPTSAQASAIAATALANDQFMLEGPAPTTPVAISVSGKDLNGATVSANLNVGATAAFYVADFTAQKVRVFDESGTPLVTPTSFPSAANPMGLAASPCTATASGNVYVSETSNFTVPFIAAYDMNGVPQSLAASAFAFTPGNYIVAQPAFLAYGAGSLFVPDEYSNMLSEFDLSGNAIASGAFADLRQPIGVAYDTHNAQIYVTNDATSTLDAYSAAGVAGASVATNSHPAGVAFDSNNDSLYVASGGTTGAALDTSTPSPANVAQYSEAPASVANTGGFAATSTTAYYSGIAFDPFTKRLYVSDAGDSSIVAYTETGAAVTLATGAFGTINATSVPKGDPMAILLVP